MRFSNETERVIDLTDLVTSDKRRSVDALRGPAKFVALEVCMVTIA